MLALWLAAAGAAEPRVAAALDVPVVHTRTTSIGGSEVDVRRSVLDGGGQVAAWLSGNERRFFTVSGLAAQRTTRWTDGDGVALSVREIRGSLDVGWATTLGRPLGERTTVPVLEVAGGLALVRSSVFRSMAVGAHTAGALGVVVGAGPVRPYLRVRTDLSVIPGGHSLIPQCIDVAGCWSYTWSPSELGASVQLGALFGG